MPGLEPANDAVLPSPKSCILLAANTAALTSREQQKRAKSKSDASQGSTHSNEGHSPTVPEQGQLSVSCRNTTFSQQPHGWPPGSSGAGASPKPDQKPLNSNSSKTRARPNLQLIESSWATGEGAESAQERLIRTMMSSQGPQLLLNPGKSVSKLFEGIMVTALHQLYSLLPLPLVQWPWIKLLKVLKNLQH